MCIAILNKKGLITKEALLNSWTANNDGAGFSYHNGKEIVIYKEMKNFALFYSTYKEARKKYTKVPFAVHFRIGTSGLINETNCHPFKVNKNISFIHNGVIFATNYVGEYSDTYHFNKEILQQLPDNWYNSKGIIQMLSDYIGASKLVFLIGANYLIINENMGHWFGGNWYSNNSYKQTIISKAYTYSEPYQYTDPYKLSDKGLCECCDSYAKLLFQYDYNMYLCSDCSKAYSNAYSYKGNKYY